MAQVDEIGLKPNQSPTSRTPVVSASQQAVASQALARKLLEMGSAGIVYPSVRRRGGTCIACFRPVLVTNVRKGYIYTFVFPDSGSRPTIRRA